MLRAMISHPNQHASLVWDRTCLCDYPSQITLSILSLSLKKTHILSYSLSLILIYIIFLSKHDLSLSWTHTHIHTHIETHTDSHSNIPSSPLRSTFGLSCLQKNIFAKLFFCKAFQRVIVLKIRQEKMCDCEHVV